MDNLDKDTLISDLQTALGAALEFIDALPADITLPAMPGFDRDWVESLLKTTTKPVNS